MTISEAKKSGQCQGCIYRLIGPGEMQCMGSSLGDTDCPGKCASSKRQGGEERR